MDILAQCNLEYKLGDRTVYVTSPQEGWLQRREFYTAGDSPTAVSVDLSVTGICWGQNGATVGEDDAGYMIAEFDDISLVKVDDRKV